MMRFFVWFLSLSFAYASFYRDDHRGWHWYEPQEAPPLEDVKESASAPLSAAQVVARYKKNLEEKMAKAWLHPTPSNIQAYQVAQKDMLDRSQLFSHVWMQSVFSHPELDHTLHVPIHQKARHIYLDQEKQRAKKVIQGLSKDYGLFFFFQCKCEYCHTFAPIVKAFASEHQWDVLAINMDGGACETFPNAIADNGLARIWEVRVLPALFAVNPKTGHVIPVSYGMVSEEDIVNRLMTLIEEKGEH